MPLGSRSDSGGGCGCGCGCGWCFKKLFDRDEFADERRCTGRNRNASTLARKARRRRLARYLAWDTGNESAGAQPVPTQNMELGSDLRKPVGKAEASPAEAASSTEGDATAIAESSPQA